MKRQKLELSLALGAIGQWSYERPFDYFVPQSSGICSAIIRPISREAVAAGDGACAKIEILHTRLRPCPASLTNTQGFVKRFHTAQGSSPGTGSGSR
jgi:hypothetical protein